MKKIIASVIALTMMATLVACGSSSEETATGDVTTVTASGFGGDFKIDVTVDEGTVTAISVDKHSETDGIGDQAIFTLIDAVLEAQSTDVDMVTGATVTSTAFLAALEEVIG